MAQESGIAVHVDADRDRCIGSGNCVMAADAVFDQDDDGTVIVLQDQPSGADALAAQEAVGLCPVEALRVEG